MDSQQYARLDAFQHSIHIRFNNQSLLLQALTHSSYVRQKNAHKQGMKDNEKLEFFGDAVLKLLVSEYLYETYPYWNEGELTKMRAHIISDNFLSQLALKLNLGELIIFSYGELRSGGDKRLSNLANAFEALLGAYYLDQGLNAVREFLITLLTDKSVLEEAQNVVDFKTRLQEWFQRHKLPLPQYDVLKEEGPDHCKTFHVQVRLKLVDEQKTFEQTGSTKKQAQQGCAKLACYVLGIGE